MHNSSNNSFIWLLAGVLCLGALVPMLFSGCESSNSSNTFEPMPAASSDSFERRYVKERFKQEGFSSSDSATAAEAVLKFHNAQQQRKR